MPFKSEQLLYLLSRAYEARHQSASAPHVISHLGDWHIDHHHRQLVREGKALQLDSNQYRALILLVEQAPMAVSKDELMAHVWQGKVVTEDSIYVVINGLRKALGDKAKQPDYIRTVSGVGYQWIAPVDRRAPFKRSYRNHFMAALAIAGVVMGSVGWWASDTSLPPMPPSARESLSRANYLVTRGPDYHTEALTLYRTLVEQYPQLAEAKVQLAATLMLDIFASDSDIVKQKSQLENMLLSALAINPDLKQAHQLLGNLYFLIFHQHDKARHHFERSLDDAESYYFYSQFLLAMGEFEAARQQLARYIERYPQGYSGEGAAWIYTMSGDYLRAHSELEKLKEFSADNRYFHVSKQALAELSGDQERAFAGLRYLIRDAGYAAEVDSLLTQIFAREGLTGVYRWLAFEDPSFLDIGQYSPPVSTARYAIGAGQHEKAIISLEQAYQANRIELLWVVADPKYRPLFAYPRFIALVDKLNLTDALQRVKNN